MVYLLIFPPNVISYWFAIVHLLMHERGTTCIEHSHLKSQN